MEKKKDLSFHMLYVNVLTIAREESKIPQITLCLLLSILNVVDVYAKVLILTYWGNVKYSTVRTLDKGKYCTWKQWNPFRRIYLREVRIFTRGTYFLSCSLFHNIFTSRY